MGLEREARIASLKSMGGTMLSAANMARGVCMAQNCANGGAGITIGGQQIVFVNGYPNNATIARLIQSTEGFNNTPANRLVKRGAATGACWVQYNQPAAAGAEPTISYNNVVMSAATENQIDNDLRVRC
jgi:hypothetical protein